MVIARVPIAFRMLAARRHYLPANVPLVKRVAATVGDEVCAVGARVTVNGRLAAKRQTRDGAGRPMPWWSGRAELGLGEYFLLMADSPASFEDRKSVVWGKSVSVSVELGGPRIIKTKNKTTTPK